MSGKCKEQPAVGWEGTASQAWPGIISVAIELYRFLYTSQLLDNDPRLVSE